MPTLRLFVIGPPACAADRHYKVRNLVHHFGKCEAVFGGVTSRTARRCKSRIAIRAPHPATAANDPSDPIMGRRGHIPVRYGPRPMIDTLRARLLYTKISF